MLTFHDFPSRFLRRLLETLEMPVTMNSPFIRPKCPVAPGYHHLNEVQPFDSISLQGELLSQEDFGLQRNQVENFTLW